MCGKASVSHLSWAEVYAFATSFTAPRALPPDPESRINISPSRLRRKSEPDSMVWEYLPVICPEGPVDAPAEAVWPFLPPWSRGALPKTREGRILSTANARLRREGAPFAPTFMGAWKNGLRVAIVTVEPNEVLTSVGHHRSPALLRSPNEALAWMRESPETALSLLRSYPDETMGVEPVPMGIKIPGNQAVELPGVLRNR